jgi:hypothetical protein
LPSDRCWRIVKADIWDRDYLDLVEPAMITSGGFVEIVFVALEADLIVRYSEPVVHFTWAGSDEMDDVSGDGHAEPLGDGAIEIAFTYQNGDEALLKVKRHASSTARQSGAQRKSN